MLNAGAVERVALSHTTTIPVLGLSTRFATNDGSMLEIVDEAFGVWRALTGHDAVDAGAGQRVDVQILVMEDGAGADRDARDATIRHHMSDDLRFVAQWGDSVAASDPARRLATIRASRAVVTDRARFRTEMLEAVVLALLSCFDRHPVHAAAVAHRGHALLLAAPSGTGKSTLAFLAHAAGLDLLSDDQVRVQLTPSLRVWGWPSRVRLLADSAARMGVTQPAEELANGKRKAVIETGHGVGVGRLVANEATVCLLSRDGGAVSLEPLAPEALTHALESQLAPGFDRFPSRWPDVARALTARGGWRLNLSDDAHDAIPIVRDLLARAGRRGLT